MMDKLFLIDTNIWTGILKQDSRDYLLKSLQLLTKQGNIKLLVPQILIEEWDIQKVKELEQYKKNYAAIIDSSTHSGSRILKPQLNSEVNKVQDKIKKIDELLKQGEQVKVSNKVKIETVNRAKLRKAPFHNKPLSISDCLLYFTAIEYLQKNEITGLIFVTRNKKDFSQPEKDAELHKDLVIDGINTMYFAELGLSFQHFREELPLPEKSLFFQQKDYIIELIEPAGLNTMSHLHATLAKAVEQVEFIPLNILSRLSPFRIRHPQREFSYHANFGLHINNQEVIDFFKSLEIGTEVKFKKGAKFRNTKDNVQKATDIVSLLNNNQVYSINSVHDNADINIRVSDTVRCDCVRCSYMKLNLSSSLLKTQNETTNISDKIKTAFVLYRFGFNKQAIQQFYAIYLEAKKNNLNIIAYRMACNLEWLKGYAEFYSDFASQQITAAVHEININQEYYALANASEYEQEIASFYYQGNFHHHYADQVGLTTDKITEHFESQLRGGYSSNSNYSNLINHYAEFESFINLNCIAFLKFSDFKRVISKYSNGLILSFFLDEYQGGKPRYINDYNLTQLAIYGDFKEIAKLYGKLSFNLIPYEKNGKRSFFQEIVFNFFSDAPKFQKTVEGFETEPNIFNREHETIFLNITVLLSIVNFEDDFLRKVNPLIFSFISDNPLKNYELRYFGWFMKRMKNILQPEELRQYFLLFVTKEKFHSEDLLCYFHNNKKGFVIDKEEDFELIVSMMLDKCNKCGSFHHGLLFSAFDLLTPAFKQKLKEKIETQLTKEMDIELYFYTALRGMIDAKKFFPSYLEQFKPMKAPHIKHHFFSRGETTYRDFNNLLNVAFQYDIELSNQFTETFKGMSDYYDWLIDMEGFDYAKFNPLWLLQYATSIYLKRALSIQQVRAAVRKYLRNNYQPQLAAYYAGHVDGN